MRHPLPALLVAASAVLGGCSDLPEMTFDDYCKDLALALVADVAAEEVDGGVEVSWTDPLDTAGRPAEGSSYSVYRRATDRDPWGEIGQAESFANGVRVSYLDAPGLEGAATVEYAVTMEGCGEVVITEDTSAKVAAARATG
ncbi:hypothetical protein [Cellulomonas xylanilytica]|uniref:Lipoprotein n=1 Tax=Cellulomonas xylanilytica TaxID=233583 RepID=A0A510V3I0_9CELL|nr:hypothetical protein [Cellulomonas xylanilytica]GEK20451.1 hypothetical protein CXY01_09710 [Cellulomonas xylanilytica]